MQNYVCYIGNIRRTTWSIGDVRRKCGPPLYSSGLSGAPSRLSWQPDASCSNCKYNISETVVIWHCIRNKKYNKHSNGVFYRCYSCKQSELMRKYIQPTGNLRWERFTHTLALLLKIYRESYNSLNCFISYLTHILVKFILLF